MSATTSLLPGGTYTVTAHYAGDGTYVTRDSSPGIPVAVTAEPGKPRFQALTLDQNGTAIPYTTVPYGANIIYPRAVVARNDSSAVYASDSSSEDGV